MDHSRSADVSAHIPGRYIAAAKAISLVRKFSVAGE